MPDSPDTTEINDDTITRHPVVLAIGGHDPGGGAGIQADIETLSSLGVHPLTLITALTIQNSVSLHGLQAVDAGVILQQFERLLDDVQIDVVKIGMLGSLDAFSAAMTILDELAGVPVVFDPVLAAGGGGEAASNALVEAIRTGLLPRTHLLTPNSVEARRLAGANSLDDTAAILLEMGVENLLITGTHEPGDEVVHQWWSADGGRDRWAWARLPGEYHGSGCTLASAISAMLARGLPLKMALGLAQAYAHDALNRAYRAGEGQSIPSRVCVATSE